MYVVRIWGEGMERLGFVCTRLVCPVQGKVAALSQQVLTVSYLPGTPDPFRSQFEVRTFTSHKYSSLTGGGVGGWGAIYELSESVLCA